MLQLTIIVANPLPIKWQKSRLIWCIDSNVEHIIAAKLPSGHFLVSSSEHELGEGPPAAIQVNNDWPESILRIWLEPIKGNKVGKGVQGNGARAESFVKNPN